jgi:hypothetical protein
MDERTLGAPRAFQILGPGTETGNVLGMVVDEEHQTLRGVRVKLGDSGRKTSRSGAFRFDRLRPGLYPATFELKGFYPLTLNIEVLEGLELDFKAFVLERCNESSCNPANRPASIQLEE